MNDIQQARGQEWRAEEYERHARFVSHLGMALVDLLDPRPGERILDIGCGDGVLTEQLIARGASVVGVDTSPEFLAAARARGIDARSMDAHELVFENEFDAAFSNAAMHWMKPDAVLPGVRRALKPGGRFAGEFGGHGNMASVVVALHAVLAQYGADASSCNPWYFPSAEEYRERLAAQGFTVMRVELIPRPTPLPTDMAGWLDTFANPFFATLPSAVRGEARARTVELLRPALCDAGGNWTADYVRLRFLATTRTSRDTDEHRRDG